jgi:hypothetical protein
MTGVVAGPFPGPLRRPDTQLSGLVLAAPGSQCTRLGVSEWITKADCAQTTRPAQKRDPIALRFTARPLHHADERVVEIDDRPTALVQ